MIDPNKFDVKAHYTAMSESKSLLISRDDVRWTENFQTPERPVDALLAFGCAVQHTPHLMREAVAVFDVLGIDWAAVTGRQFCCGRPLERSGYAKQGEQVSSKSYERFQAYQPNVVVQWCGACMLQYLDVISKQANPPFDVVHVTKYLARLLRRRADSVPWAKQVRRRVGLHTHSQFLPQQDVDAASILEILEMIPGVEYVGPIRPPSAGAPCDLVGGKGVSVLHELSTEEYRAAQRELVDQARAIGADTLVTPYHKCQMEWSKFSGKQLAVREWMSLLAEALGVGYDDNYTVYWHLGDPEQIVQRSRDQWSSWGWTEEQALDAARRHFVPAYAVDLHECDCGGTGCGSGGVELITNLGAD